MVTQPTSGYSETIQKWRKQIRWYFYSLLIWTPIAPTIIFIFLAVFHGRQMSKEEYFSREVRLMRIVAWFGLFFGIALISIPIGIICAKFGWRSIEDIISLLFLLLVGFSLLTIHASVAYLLAIRKLKKIYELEIKVTGKTKQPEPLCEKKNVVRGLMAFSVVIVFILLFAWLYVTIIEPRL